MTARRNEIGGPAAARVRIRRIGDPNDGRLRPAVVVMGGISSDEFPVLRPDGRRGWWPSIVGPGKAIDTSAHAVFGVGFATASGRFGGTVSTHEQADFLRIALDDAGCPTPATIVGASYGGMVALAFADLFPALLRSAVVIAAAHRPSAFGLAIRMIQRKIVLEASAAERDRALALARQIAMLSYRTPAEFESRFGAMPTNADALADYLEPAGVRFCGTTSVDHWLALSSSIDGHLVDPSRISSDVSLIAFEGDMLVPPDIVGELHRAMPARSTLYIVRSAYGHDAFLKEEAAMRELILNIFSTAGIRNEEADAALVPHQFE